MNRFARNEDGQGLVEFALVLPPILILLVFGLVELAGLMSDSITIASATRALLVIAFGGMRVALGAWRQGEDRAEAYQHVRGVALANGGGTLGCASGQSPNAATVDQNIVAAVQRVLTGTGTRVTLADVSEIRIWKSTSSGAETANLINVWTYLPDGGPVVDGNALDFVQTSQPWLPCTRTYIAPIDSVGVTVSYTYRARTPLKFFFPFFDLLKITDRAVMSMNVAK